MHVTKPVRGTAGGPASDGAHVLALNDFPPSLGTDSFPASFASLSI